MRQPWRTAGTVYVQASSKFALAVCRGGHISPAPACHPTQEIAPQFALRSPSRPGSPRHRRTGYQRVCVSSSINQLARDEMRGQGSGTAHKMMCPTPALAQAMLEHILKNYWATRSLLCGSAPVLKYRCTLRPGVPLVLRKGLLETFWRSALAAEGLFHSSPTAC